MWLLTGCGWWVNIVYTVFDNRCNRYIMTNYIIALNYPLSLLLLLWGKLLFKKSLNDRKSSLLSLLLFFFESYFVFNANYDKFK